MEKNLAEDSPSRRDFLMTTGLVLALPATPRVQAGVGFW